MEPLSVSQWLFQYRTRLFVLLICLSAISMMFVAQNSLVAAWHELALVQQQLNQARDRTSLLKQANEAADQRRLYQADRQVLQTEMASNRFLPQDWSRRELKVDSAELHRKLVQVYISELKNRPDYFFIPKTFVLRTMHDGEGLFSWGLGQSPNLHLSLAGTYYMRDSAISTAYIRGTN